jgi:hypothetical protein
MPSIDPRIDAYIEKSQEFARPILTHLRQVVHAACPEVQETMKWSMPHFDYKGIMAGMAAFKQHCTFGFWKGSMIPGVGGAGDSADGMGQFGRITRLGDLPSDEVLTDYIHQAMRLNDEGAKPRKTKKEPKGEAEVPADLAEALAGNEAARATFHDRFSPSHRREYVEWITEAKTEATRAKRLATTLEWLAEGKRRNWKYENC